MGGEVLPICAMPINNISATVSLSMKAHFPKLCRNREPGTLLTVYNNCLIIDTDLKYLSFPESVAQREMNTKGSAFISRVSKQFFEGSSSSAFLWLRADPTKTAFASLDPQLHKDLQVFPYIASPLEWAVTCSVEQKKLGISTRQPPALILSPTVRLGTGWQMQWLSTQRELESSKPYGLSVHTPRSQFVHKFELLIIPQGK